MSDNSEYARLADARDAARKLSNTKRKEAGELVAKLKALQARNEFPDDGYGIEDGHGMSLGDISSRDFDLILAAVESSLLAPNAGGVDDSGLVKALEEEIEHHLSWITNYAKSTTENNWRDMAARIENQAALLRETLRALKTKEVNGAPPEPENDELDHFWEMDRSGKLVRVDIPPKEPAR